MGRLLLLVLLLSAVPLVADAQEKLEAPEDWRGETIKLPPAFAPDMKLKGEEVIRFAPGMFQPGSDSFFTYVFAFEVEPRPELTEKILKDEFLKYYRGLCEAVLGGSIARKGLIQ